VGFGIIPGSLKRYLLLEFRRKLYLFPVAAGSPPALKFLFLFVFPAIGVETAREFTVYKKRRLDHTYTAILLKTSFRSATYELQAHRPIYRVVGVLVDYHNLCDSVRRTVVIVALGRPRRPTGWSRRQRREAPDASGHSGMIINPWDFSRASFVSQPVLAETQIGTCNPAPCAWLPRANKAGLNRGDRSGAPIPRSQPSG